MAIIKPNLAELIRFAPELKEKLQGGLGPNPNAYFDENVVSWPLLGSRHRNPELKKDSTVGVIQGGPWEFPTDFAEHVYVLKGGLYVSINKGLESVLRCPQAVITKPNDLLRVKAEEGQNGNQAIYVCEYY